jgi:mannose-1-phosphate guanylyltransferase
MNDGNAPFVPVIMAGGQGQRFWPLSTPERPKQFLDLGHLGRTLIQATLERVAPLAEGPEHVFVATAERYLPLVAEQLPDVPRANLLVEPVGRDSAPAIALACLTIERRYGNAVVGMFSSDHQIEDGDAFQRTLRRAVGVAERTRGLVTIGIRPTRPATGYGYIERGHPVDPHRDDEGPSVPAYHVARFVEKPNARTAEAYLESGRFLWNAGIFVWTTAAIVKELDRYAPAMMAALRRALDRGTVAEAFPRLPKISIDFAVMERTRHAFVVPGDFAWDDIGDWVALERLLKQGDGAAAAEAGSNTVVGRHVGLETSGNIVYTEDPDDVVVTLGVRDLVIVKRGNTVLLVRKDRVQDIKQLLADERLASLLE